MENIRRNQKPQGDKKLEASCSHKKSTRGEMRTHTPPDRDNNERQVKIMRVVINTQKVKTTETGRRDVK